MKKIFSYMLLAAIMMVGSITVMHAQDDEPEAGISKTHFVKSEVQTFITVAAAPAVSIYVVVDLPMRTNVPKQIDAQTSFTRYSVSLSKSDYYWPRKQSFKHRCSRNC